MRVANQRLTRAIIIISMVVVGFGGLALYAGLFYGVNVAIEIIGSSTFRTLLTLYGLLMAIGIAYLIGKERAEQQYDDQEEDRVELRQA